MGIKDWSEWNDEVTEHQYLRSDLLHQRLRKKGEEQVLQTARSVASAAVSVVVLVVVVVVIK
jgi:hypothetical protein